MGDPLDPEHREGLKELIQVLKENGAWVNIEAAGNVIDHEIFDDVGISGNAQDCVHHAVDFISFDYKTPSTKVLTPISHIKEVVEKYSYKLQIKSVVFDQSDFEFVNQAKDEVFNALPEIDLPWILTPVFNYGEDFPKERVHDIDFKVDKIVSGKILIVGMKLQTSGKSLPRHLPAAQVDGANYERGNEALMKKFI